MGRGFDNVTGDYIEMLRRITSLQWDRITAAHLLNRAGFGAAPERVVAAAGANPADLVESLVENMPDAAVLDKPDWVTPEAALRPDREMRRRLNDEERRDMQRMQRKTERERLTDLRGWWINRMRNSPNPLQEKLTLFWHGHFATSFEKVRSAYAMYKQNQMFRRNAAGNWRDLLMDVSQDPAMLWYLDNANSRKQSPNENYARELMELFTLGEGHYTEEDIRASARAFTGWSVDSAEIAFKVNHQAHDNGSKHFFGKTGHFYGSDIINLILEHREAAPFICRKLWTFFAYPDPEERLVNSLADTLRRHDYDLKPMLKEMFLSREFYATQALRTQIKSPVQWLVNTSILLETDLPPAPVSETILQALGQKLFEPPSVKGWDGGYAWITTASLFQRYNIAGILVRGGEPYRRNRRGQFMPRMGQILQYDPEVDPRTLVSEEERASQDDAAKALMWRLFQGPLRDDDIAKLRKNFQSMPDPWLWSDQEILNLVHTLMSTPHYQLT